jgi:hypothetical protein
VYSTCLYCTGTLGHNTVVEALPVGRRLAFDPAAGRLWVVCWLCARWNLVPFDSRLEAIDACERAFRGTHARWSTDQIGMARLPEGLELIRIGKPLRPEFAAWRYGRRLRRRRRRVTPPVGSGGGLVGALHDGLETLGRLVALRLVDPEVRVGFALARHRLIRDPWTDRLVQVPVTAIAHATLVVDESRAWRLELPYRTELDELVGTDPLQLMSMRDHPGIGLFHGAAVLPTLGRTLAVFERGRPAEALVVEATRILDRTAGNPAALLAYVAAGPLRLTTARQFPLMQVAPEVRLALEMAAHEETERRAMEGELRLLEREWREADQVARIADELALEVS